MRKMSAILNRTDDRIQKVISGTSADTIQGKYQGTAKFGLINSITKRWVDTGMKESPEEMIYYIMSLIAVI